MLREHKAERPQLVTSRHSHNPTTHTTHSVVGATAPQGKSDFLDLVGGDQEDEVEVEGRDGEAEVTENEHLLLM